MTEKVGGIFYEVDLDTGRMIDGQRKVKRELDKTSGSLDGFSSKLTQVAGAISVMAVAMAALKSAQMADDMRLLGAKVQVAAGNIQAGADAMAALEAISKRTSTSVAANAEVFTRLNQSILQMGGTQQDTLNITELLGKAIRVSGASAVEAKSAMLQFGQALGSGKLAGDELRSLMENAPYLMRQLADGIGVPVGALKQLGEDGALTADVVTNALSKAATQIDADFQKFPQTIASSMDVAMDAAGRANLALDDLTGTSAALTGVIKGTGEVLDELAIQFGEASGAADELGKNESINAWANAAKLSLSYVIDAFDGVTRAVQITGKWLGSVSSLVVMNLKGDFAEAKAAGLEFEKDISDLMNKPLAGQRMRDQFASGVARPGPAKGPTGTIKGTTGGGKSGGAGKGRGQKFDGAGYLSGLEAASVDAWTKVGVVEEEARRKNDKLLSEKKISAEMHEKAITIIAATAAKDRQDIMEAEFSKAVEIGERRLEAQEQNRAFAQETIAAVDPIDAINLEEQRRIEVMDQYRQQDLGSSQLYEDAKTAIHRMASEARQSIAQREFDQQSSNNIRSIGLAANVADGMYAIMEKAGKEKSSLGKALFLTSKALAVAEILLNTEVAASKAGAQLGVFGIPMATMIRATGYASAGMVAGMALGELAGGRQYGGPVSAGSLYRVNETGAPEMFTAGNGSQFMLANSSGRVTAADKVGGGGVQMSVQVINNHPTAQVTTRTDENGRNAQIVIAEVANQIASNSGPIWSAMRGATNIQGRM